MRRVLGLFAIAVIVAFAAVWLATLKGHFALQIGNWQIHMSAGLFVGVTTVFAFLVIILARVLGLVLGAPQALGRWWQLRRQRRGEDALSQALVAAATGELKDVQQWSNHVSPTLATSPLGLLLGAQVASLSGDAEAEAAANQAMLNSTQTEFLGLKGLFRLALAQGDSERALALGLRAYELKPRATWPIQALFDLRTARGEWHEAKALLDDADKARLMAAAILRRRRAVLLAVLALEAEATAPKKSLDLALQALDLEPGLLCAAILAARRLVYIGKDRRAQDVIERAWSAAPHPDLAAAYAAIFPRDTTPERSARLLHLAGVLPRHFESCVLEAEQHIAMNRWSDARRVLAPWAQGEISARICMLLAEIEERQHRDSVSAHDWLLRAVRAPRDSDFRCTRCGAHSAHWHALCGQCKGFDTLVWLAPENPQPATSDADKLAPPTAAALPAPDDLGLAGVAFDKITRGQPPPS
jgi:HemY protein